jgi:acetyltransferase-like isoleucine patch superfamily enzyme
MYIESKAESLNGPARIGRVTFSKTGLSIYYGGKTFIRTNGFKANYVDEDTREEYWISGPRQDGLDRLYKSNLPIEIDEDVREEYWMTIRKKPEYKDRSSA